ERLRLDIAKRHRPLRGVGIAPRGHRAHQLAVPPDRLAADDVSIDRLDNAGGEAPLQSPTARPQRRNAPGEALLLQRDQALEARVPGRVDRPVFARPRAKALFQPEGVEGTGAEGPDAEIRADVEEEVQQGALVLGLDPDLVSEVAGIADTPDERWKHADVE